MLVDLSYFHILRLDTIGYFLVQPRRSNSFCIMLRLVNRFEQHLHTESEWWRGIAVSLASAQFGGKGVEFDGIATIALW